MASRPSIEITGRVSYDRGTGVDAVRRASIDVSRTSFDSNAVRASIDQNRKVSKEIARTSIDVAVGYQEAKAKVGEARQSVSQKKKGGRDLNELKREVDMDEHTISIDELVARLGTNLTTGLSKKEAEDRLSRYGMNRLTPPKVTPEWVKFLQQMFTGFSCLLWAGAALSFISYGIDGAADNFSLGWALVITVVLTGTFAYWQDAKSSKVMEGFKQLISTTTRVIRDGEKLDIDAIHVVPGDLIDLSSGNKVSADIRVVHSANMKVDNSSLTGEPEPLLRTTENTHDNPLETKNLAFFGTMVADGSGRGIAIRTGDNTVIGRIAGLATGTARRKTPIQHEIDRFVKIISVIALLIGCVFFGIGFTIYSPVTNLVFGIGIIVANVPEGLIATVTVCMTHAARKMASKNVLVKSLQSVETLGSTSTICSDKTGTLTQNRMTVVHCYYDLEIKVADASLASNDTSGTFAQLQRIATLCNKASFDPTTMDQPVLQRKTFGDATESGLIKFLDPVKNVEEFRTNYPKIVEIPFNSQNKYQLSIHVNPEDPKLLLVMKGAPERIVDRCATILVNGKELPMDEAMKKTVNAANEELASKGERVLGFAQLHLDPTVYTKEFEFDTNGAVPNFPTEKLCFVGLMALIDPPREAVPGAVAKCHTAGIKVIMVTGDHPITAKAIAQQVGIIKNDTKEDLIKKGMSPEEAEKNAKAIVVTGTEIKDLEEDDWKRILSKQDIVFARTSPQQKLLIVEANQKQGAIVAVTGDGVNDSPALKKADIGIAMGIAGSDISKEAAHMVLLDDNFASIVAGIEEGRLIFDNLKKSIAYTLEHLGAEVVPFLLFFVFRVPLPLTTVLILCIDLGTDLFPAISLAYEQPETDIMTRPPRNPRTDNLVGARLFVFSYFQIGIFEVMGALCAYFSMLGYYGFSPSQLSQTAEDWEDDEKLIVAGENYEYREEALKATQTAVFLSIVIVQWGGLVICKTRKLSLFQQGMRNHALNISLVVETILAIIIVYVPGIQDVLGTHPVNWVGWLPAMPFALIIIIYDEIRKWLIRRNPNGIVAYLTYY